MTERDFVFWLDGFMEEIFNPTDAANKKETPRSINDVLIRIYTQLQTTKRKIS